MGAQRKRSQFGIYRVIQGKSVFVSNHLTEQDATHTAACLQVPAPDGVSYVVDPPFGPLSGAAKEPRFWPQLVSTKTSRDG
jgi:hypothetical protein